MRVVQSLLSISWRIINVTSRFFAFLERLRWIQRWGLKRNLVTENVMEHSWQVATIAHALAEIRLRIFGQQIDVGKVVIAALYHDASEIITGRGISADQNANATPMAVSTSAAAANSG